VDDNWDIYPLGFTVQDYIKFRDTHLTDAEEIIIHFHGGEPFYKENLALIKEFQDNTTMEQFDFLTNGLYSSEYANPVHPILDFERVNRIGFTWHYAEHRMPDRHESQLVYNIKRLAEHYSDRIYVKLLLVPGGTQSKYDGGISILHERLEYCKINFPNVKVKIQTMQALDSTPLNFSDEEWNLVSDEYIHDSDYCMCKKGYRTFNIRGYDRYSGEIVACWFDPKIIGSIQRNELDKNYLVLIDPSLCRTNVIGGEYGYGATGTYPRDRIPGDCG
jgi:hypothetical protein